MSNTIRCAIDGCPGAVEHDGDLCPEHIAALARGIAAARRFAASTPGQTRPARERPLRVRRDGRTARAR